MLPLNAIAQVEPADTLKKVSADTLALPPEEEGEELTERVNYNAEDSVVAVPGQSRAILYGKAKVEYEGMTIEAARLDINYATSVVKAYGTLDSTGKKTGLPVFKDGGQDMEADTIKYNPRTKKGKIYNAMTQQGELLVLGSEIKKDSNDITYFRHMRCLPCQEADARTAFIATKAKVIPNDKIVTGPMYLEIGGVPTPLGLPFGYFPNTKRRHNGILLPQFGNSPDQGYFLKQGGFYWGINDMTDLTFRGDIYSNGSYVIGATNQYLVLYKASGSLSGTFSEFNIGDKDLKDVPGRFSKKRAYALDWRHTQDNRSNPTARFSSNVNFRINQDINRLNAINSGQFLQNTFQSNISYSKSWKFGVLGLNGSHTQNSISKQMSIDLPVLTFNVNRFFPFKRESAVRQNVFDKIGVNYLFQFTNRLTGTDSSIFKGNVIDNLQNGFRHDLPISTNFNIFKYITATPALNLTSVMYTQTLRRDYVILSDSTDPETGKVIRRSEVRTRTLKRPAAGYDGVFSTAFNTQVFFDYFFLGKRLKQVRHLLIPTLTYSYRPDFGEAQYGFWKSVQRDSLGNTMRYSIFERGIFSGPASGKTNAISLNLNNNFEAKVRQKTDTGTTDKKIVLLQNISMAGSYNFAADSFQMSDVSATARTVLFKYFNVNASAGFEPYRFDRENGRLRQQLQYDYDGRLARMTQLSFAVSSSIGSNMLEALKKLKEAPDVTNGAERGSDTKAATGGPVPWNLSLSYVLNLANANDTRLQPSQTFNFSGDVMPTKNWRVGITSGLDFATQKLSYTSVNIYRNLKCWEARIDWVPFGIRKSYSLYINLKSSMLRDFKIPRQRQWFDNIE
jgi:hypothetical protein